MGFTSGLTCLQNVYPTKSELSKKYCATIIINALSKYLLPFQIKVCGAMV